MLEVEEGAGGLVKRKVSNKLDVEEQLIEEVLSEDWEVLWWVVFSSKHSVFCIHSLFLEALALRQLDN